VLWLRAWLSPVIRSLPLQISTDPEEEDGSDGDTLSSSRKRNQDVFIAGFKALVLSTSIIADTTHALLESGSKQDNYLATYESTTEVAHRLAVPDAAGSLNKRLCLREDLLLSPRGLQPGTPGVDLTELKKTVFTWMWCAWFDGKVLECVGGAPDQEDSEPGQ